MSNKKQITYALKEVSRELNTTGMLSSDVDAIDHKQHFDPGHGLLLD